MTHLPDGVRGKGLALAIAFAVLAFVQIFAVSPLYAYCMKTAQELQDRWDRVERYRNAVGELPELRKAAAAIQQGGAGTGLLFEETSDALAAAALQSSLKMIVEHEGAKLISAQTLPPQADGQLQRVGLHIAFSASLTLLTTVLLQIETSHPVLSVANLDLRRSAGAETMDLSVAMDVYGFRPL